MPKNVDGLASPHFKSVTLKGNTSIAQLTKGRFTNDLKKAAPFASTGNCVCMGIPFAIKKVVALVDKPITVKLNRLNAPWLIFLHASDVRPDVFNKDGFISPMKGIGKLNEHAADYVFIYEDGEEHRVPIHRRNQIGAIQRIWGENCVGSMPHKKPQSVGTQATQPGPGLWGKRQVRGGNIDGGRWVNWLWAFKNPRPDKALTAIRFEPVSGAVIVSGLAAGQASSNPLRWESRKKAILTLPKSQPFDPILNSRGLLKQIQLDLGQVISVEPRRIYPNRSWAKTHQYLKPDTHEQECLVEYSAHPDAHFTLWNKRSVPLKQLSIKKKTPSAPLKPIKEATQTVTIRTIDQVSRKPVPVKLHVHGEAGEYLAPVDRHRILNGQWFEDYSTDWVHGAHWTTYISGETRIKVPRGQVYVEVTKGFEIKPIRRVFKVTQETTELTLELEKVLPWRENGWVTADTHVHFISPATAQLEGSAEGVNVINLLASQWGELMTNVGDFDGKTTFGSKDAGGDGEYLVRVGTENRQHVLGHISLLGYEGQPILPLCSGGLDESALGDPAEILLTEWARQCKSQGGLVIMPHFPNPRMENAASIVLGEIDGIEFCEGFSPYAGINPYSLSDWYRYLNNGYALPAVGGTDKMCAQHAVGLVRTYARIPKEKEFSYPQWMDAVRGGETFVTNGPLLEFEVEGHRMGQRLNLSATGGTLSVNWKAASTIVPMTRIELIVNGEIIEGKKLNPDADEGTWSIKVDKSSWVALLIRAKYKNRPEMIAAHSSAVMAEVKGSPFYAAADAATILEQIEGSMTFLDAMGTKAEVKRYKEMRMVLESAYRQLHNRMHQMGEYHSHSHTTDHKEHH